MCIYIYEGSYPLLKGESGTPCTHLPVVPQQVLQLGKEYLLISFSSIINWPGKGNNPCSLAFALLFLGNHDLQWGDGCSRHITIKASKREVGIFYRSEKSNSWLCHFMCHACFVQLWMSVKRRLHFTLEPPVLQMEVCNCLLNSWSITCIAYFCLQMVGTVLTIHCISSFLGGQGREGLKRCKLRQQ